MPIYTYQCKQEHEFERLVSLSDVDGSGKVRCPECKGVARRVMVAFAEHNSSKNKSDGYRERKRYTNW